MSQTKAQLISDLVQALNFTGTASAPANGLFLSATNTLQLSTASTPRLTINSDGHVDVVGNLDVGAGIDVTGHATVSQSLTVTGTTSLGETVNITGNDPNITFVDSDNNPDFKIFGNGGTLNFVDSTNSANRIVINSDGHVDIPGNLDVGAGIDVAGASTLDGGNVTNSLQIDGTGGHELYSYHDSGGVGWATGAGGTYGELLYLDESGSTVRLYSGGTERFRVSGTEAVFNETGASVDFRVEGDTSTHLLFVDASTDRVGIGTSSPAIDGLHVTGGHGAGILSQSAGTTGGGLIRMQNTQGSTQEFYFAVGGGANNYVQGRGLFLRDETSGENRLSLLTNGNVGIGTTNPSGKLDIVTGANGGNVLIDAESSSGYHAKVVNDSGDLTLGARNTSADTKLTSQRHIHFLTGSSEAESMLIDSSGNVGIGVTPKTGQYSGYNNLQIGESALLASNDTQGDTNITSLSQNVYLNSNASAWKYLHTDEATRYQQYNGGHFFDVAASGSADATATFSNRVRIDSDGLKFNGDSAAANALDDYEEGTFTPNNTIGMPLTSNFPAQYVKVGNLCHIVMDITFNSSPADTSQCGIIQSLPFAAANITNGEQYVNFPFISNTSDNNLDYDIANTVTFIEKNETSIKIFNFGLNAIQSRAFLAGRRMRFNFCYRTG